MKSTPRVPIDDLRRFATELGIAAGLAPGRASSLAGFALWFEEIDRGDSGLVRLADWLDRIDNGEFDPRLVGEIARPEPAAAAVLDGTRVLPPLLLERAAEIASEKAREVGMGLVRITNLAEPCPLASVAANLAIGPTAGLVLGPGAVMALGIPTGGGLPIVYESTPEAQGPNLAEGLTVPWRAMIQDGDYLVLAARGSILFPSEGSQRHIERMLATSTAPPGLLLPGPWEARRSKARESGISLPKGTRDRLKTSGERLGVAAPWGRR